MKGKNILNIVTVHDFTYEKKLTSLKRFVHIHQKKKSLFNADGIICISNNTKSDMLEIYPQLKKKMISVIYNSYDEINFFNIKNSNYEDNQVLFVGGRNGYKNFKLAVDSVSLSNDLFLNIVGSDLTSKEIEFLNLKLGKNRYKLYKYLSPKELNELYNKNLCLLYLSEYEGFGIPILEAMSAGCPVIVSNNSSIPEVAGAAGIYIKLDPQDVLEKINQIRLDNVFRQNIVIKGLNNVKKFSWLESAKQVELFYSRILNS
jgi:mannosyltransferase